MENDIYDVVLFVEDRVGPRRLVRTPESGNTMRDLIGLWYNQAKYMGTPRFPIVCKEHAGRATDYLSSAISKIDNFPYDLK